MPSAAYLFAFAFAAALSGPMFAHRQRSGRRPLSHHRCRAHPLFSQVGRSSFQLDAVVESCDDPSVARGTPFSLRLTRPTRRNDYLFSRVRASVERGHVLVVDVEDHLTARKARLCANGWTVVLDVVQSAGWPVRR
jgi:asparagine synthetase B (glutamine-hydrolysing)